MYLLRITLIFVVSLISYAPHAIGGCEKELKRLIAALDVQRFAALENPREGTPAWHQLQQAEKNVQGCEKELAKCETREREKELKHKAAQKEVIPDSVRRESEKCHQEEHRRRTRENQYGAMDDRWTLDVTCHQPAQGAAAGGHGESDRQLLEGLEQSRVQQAYEAQQRAVAERSALEHYAQQAQQRNDEAEGADEGR